MTDLLSLVTSLKAAAEARPSEPDDTPWGDGGLRLNFSAGEIGRHRYIKLEATLLRGKVTLKTMLPRVQSAAQEVNFNLPIAAKAARKIGRKYTWLWYVNASGKLLERPP